MNLLIIFISLLFLTFNSALGALTCEKKFLPKWESTMSIGLRANLEPGKGAPLKVTIIVRVPRESMMLKSEAEQATQILRQLDLSHLRGTLMYRQEPLDPHEGSPASNSVLRTLVIYDVPLDFEAMITLTNRNDVLWAGMRFTPSAWNRAMKIEQHLRQKDSIQ